MYQSSANSGHQTSSDIFKAINSCHACGGFTLPDTDTETDTETAEMYTEPYGVLVCMQYEHLHTILIKQFYIGSGVGQCERTFKGPMDDFLFYQLILLFD